MRQDADPTPSMPTAAAENPRPLRNGRWRRGVRPGVVAAPWVLALALLAMRGPGLDHAAPPGAAPDGDSTVIPSDIPTAVAGSDIPTGDADGRAAVTAEATAVRLVRDAVTRRRGDRVTALDVAAPERARPLEPAVWMVRVHAVVLQGDRRRWHSAAHEIWAVPISTADGRTVGLEHPWRVAQSDGGVEAGPWQPAEIAEGQVHAALRAAGLQPADDMPIERRPGMTGVLRAGIVTDGVSGHAWLRTGPPLEVLGSAKDGS